MSIRQQGHSVVIPSSTHIADLCSFPRSKTVKSLSLYLLHINSKTLLETISVKFPNLENLDFHRRCKRLRLVAEAFPELKSVWLRDINAKVNFEKVNKMIHSFEFFKNIGQNAVNISMEIRVDIKTKVFLIVSETGETPFEGGNRFMFYGGFHTGFRTAKIIAAFLNLTLSMKTEYVSISFTTSHKRRHKLPPTLSSDIVREVKAQRHLVHMKSLYLTFTDEDDKVLSVVLSRIHDLDVLSVDTSDIRKVTESFVEAHTNITVRRYLFREKGLWFENYEMTRFKHLMSVIKKLEKTSDFRIEFLVDSCIEKTFQKLSQAFGETFKTLVQIAESRPVHDFQIDVIRDSVKVSNVPFNLKIKEHEHFQIAAWNETVENEERPLYEIKLGKGGLFDTFYVMRREAMYRCLLE